MPFSDQATIFHAQLLILIVKLYDIVEKIYLEHELDGNDVIMLGGRPALTDEQFNQRNPRSNWTQCVAKVQKYETCLRIRGGDSYTFGFARATPTSKSATPIPVSATPT